MLKPPPFTDLHSDSQSKVNEPLDLSCELGTVIRSLRAWFALPPVASHEDISAKSIGEIALLAIGCLFVIAIFVFGVVWENKQQVEEERFLAWTEKHIRDVDETIERLALEISRRESKRNEFFKTCLFLEIDYGEDPDYRRWGKEAIELTKERESLIQTRKRAYLETYKAGLDSDPEREVLPRKMALHALREAHRVSRVIQDYRVPSSPGLEPAPPGLGPQTSSTESRPTSSSP